MASNTTDFSEDAMIPMPAPIPEGLVAPTKEAFIVTGDVATGKTQELIDRVQSLLTAGVNPDQICVFCATPTAARCFQARLAQVSELVKQIKVTTPRQMAQELLGVEEVAEATGRGNRLLAPFEMDFLLEDLKTSGVRPGRLKEMLRFFYKSLTELCDWGEEEWLLTGEENMVWDVLQDCLQAYGAILEPELANTVARYLHEHTSAEQKYGVAHVLVDDYQLLNRASQVLVNELAQESIMVAANPALSIEVFDSYPYTAGIDEFKEANPAAAETKLETSFASDLAQHCHNGLATSSFVAAEPFVDSDSEPPMFKIELFDSPAQECQAVVQKVQEALEGGVDPSDIVVVSPHKIWDANIISALKRREIPVQTINDGSALRGDLRDLKKSEAARILTALLLVADSTNTLAWRAWCGFGDHFANSSALTSIREWAYEQSLPLDQALQTYYETHDSIDQNVAEHAHVASAVTSGVALIEQAQDKQGEELLGFLTTQVAGENASIPAALRALTAPFADDENAAGGESPSEGVAGASVPAGERTLSHFTAPAALMAARARQRMDFPGLDASVGVKVLPLSQVSGVAINDLILCGFVNGFLPKRGVLDREISTQEEADKQTAKDLAALMNALAKPRRAMVATGFKELPLENAERLKLRIHRIQLKDGARMASIEPSAYEVYCNV